jgi:hypothetical protein
MCQKIPKENNSPNGKNSPNLVTLNPFIFSTTGVVMSSDFRYFFDKKLAFS